MRLQGTRELDTIEVRERFVDHSYTNGWGWLYPTVVGALFVPAQTLETAGVLEATLLDAASGTLLFTVNERVRTARTANLWHTDDKMRAMQASLSLAAAAHLAEQVVAEARRLANRASVATGETWSSDEILRGYDRR